MSGSITYDRMKKINPDIKVLLASGYSINGRATEILDRGCNGFIQKPFKLKELSQKLREILDEKLAQKCDYFCQRPMLQYYCCCREFIIAKLQIPQAEC
jgi:DNA-binding NtrC family response regulator